MVVVEKDPEAMLSVCVPRGPCSIKRVISTREVHQEQEQEQEQEEQEEQEQEQEAAAPRYSLHVRAPWLHLPLRWLPAELVEEELVRELVAEFLPEFVARRPRTLRRLLRLLRLLNCPQCPHRWPLYLLASLHLASKRTGMRSQTAQILNVSTEWRSASRRSRQTSHSGS